MVGEQETVEGVVKWFDPDRGFGFIVCDQLDGDVLLHANVLRNFGQSSVADGAQVSIVVARTDRGLQANEVLTIDVPDGEAVPASGAPEELDSIDLMTVPLVAGRVKWFDRIKGFGFANVWGQKEDVFIHIEVLRRSGLAELQPGEAIALRVTEGRRGAMAVQVCSWDAGLS